VILSNIKVGTNGGTQTLNVKIEWIDKPEPLHGTVMIIFTEVPDITDLYKQTIKGKKIIDQIAQSELEKELQHMREEMQSTIEEMQTSQEELKSTNEELQSTNEELQSTNEELTTSKEEMQSLNEELQTVNAELQSKVEDFSRVNNDMKNLLNSTDIATLFLDKDLNIRRYTNQATKIFKLIKGDIGRPFTDLVSDLTYPELADDALEVLRTLVFIQKQIPAKNERWFSVRIMPYRTLDDRIDGLVITFINLSDLKHVELKLHETEQMNRSLLNSSSHAIIKLSPDGIIQEFNNEAEKYFGKKYNDAMNQDFIKMFIPETVRKKTEKDMNKLLDEMIDGKIKTKLIVAGGKMPVVEWSVNILLNSLKMPAGILLSQKNAKL
jgi:two-component system CheB/CheR fusion protein